MNQLTDSKADTAIIQRLFEHGIKSACYYNTPHGLVATFTCLCGEEIDGDTSAWGDAGIEFDRHLRETGTRV